MLLMAHEANYRLPADSGRAEDFSTVRHINRNLQGRFVESVMGFPGFHQWLATCCGAIAPCFHSAANMLCEYTI